MKMKQMFMVVILLLALTGCYYEQTSLDDCVEADKELKEFCNDEQLDDGLQFKDFDNYRTCMKELCYEKIYGQQ